MIDFWPKAIFHQRFPPKISCACATPKNIRFQKQSTITPGVNWRCPRNRNSPRETYFPFPKSVILYAVRIESHDVNDLPHVISDICDIVPRHLSSRVSDKNEV